MDDKVEAFAECLCGDIFASFAEAMEVKIQYSSDREERRCVPDDFHCYIVTFSKGFIDKLMPDVTNLPVFLCSSERFFVRFVSSVCVKLVSNEDMEIVFLKVMAFLTVITSMFFLNCCYRFTLDIPLLLKKLLQEHIKTKFYEENGFDAISLRCQNLKEDEQWYESTVEEIRSCMRESLETELAASGTDNSFRSDRPNIKILEVRSQAELLDPDSNSCPYCGTLCFNFLKAFFKPRIIYKPGYELS